MRERIAGFCALLLLAIIRALLPARGRHHERKLQRQRRRALWLAVHGIDVGPRHIHGMEVSA